MFLDPWFVNQGLLIRELWLYPGAKHAIYMWPSTLQGQTQKHICAHARAHAYSSTRRTTKWLRLQPDHVWCALIFSTVPYFSYSTLFLQTKLDPTNAPLLRTWTTFFSRVLCSGASSSLILFSLSSLATSVSAEPLIPSCNMYLFLVTPTKLCLGVKGGGMHNSPRATTVQQGNEWH